MIECLECEQSHAVPPASSSSLCPHCGAYISLENFEINGDWSRRIQTRGDVNVGRSGNIRGVLVQCYNLTIKGTFNGGADCNGDLLITSSATINGRARCRHLQLGKRASLHLSHPLQSEEATINGPFHGNLVCTGRVTLRKHAIVHGDIKAGSLIIQTGARHNGSVQMTNPSLASRISDVLSEED